MSAPAQAAPSPASRSFAGMLADFATPVKKFPPARDLDGLADDIATLSYEHALKTHARYHPFPDHAMSPETQPLQPAFPGCLPLFTHGPGVDDLGHQERAHQDPRSENSVSGSAAQPSRTTAVSADAASRKAASVTVRLTRAEDDRLRQRAAEAGLTISAYLRSCAFEVETLRAQVKQTIAEMRHAEPAPLPQPERKSSFSRLFSWRKRAAAPAA